LSDYPPRFYDVIHSGNPGDVDFYLAACEGARGVLELGCGSGRVSRALVESGHRVVGIDINPLMVEAAVAGMSGRGGGSFEGRVADMRSFDLEERFDRIIAPYNVLLCMVKEGDLERCLKRVAGHLFDNGVFACDFYVAPFEAGSCSGAAAEHLASVELDGELVHIFERDISRGSLSRFDVEYIYRRETSEGVVESRFFILQRAVRLEELEQTARKVGMNVREVFPDFAGGKVDNEVNSLACLVSKMAP
jgi:SAM-dependent methyltransferase